MLMLKFLCNANPCKGSSEVSQNEYKTPTFPSLNEKRAARPGQFKASGPCRVRPETRSVAERSVHTRRLAVLKGRHGAEGAGVFLSGPRGERGQ